MADEVTNEQQQPAGEPAPSRITQVRHGLARGTALTSAVLFAAFALANRQFVEFSWLVGRSELRMEDGERLSGGVPLILLLLAAFVLGAVTGVAGSWWRARRRRRRPEG